MAKSGGKAAHKSGGSHLKGGISTSGKKGKKDKMAKKGGKPFGKK